MRDTPPNSSLTVDDADGTDLLRAVLADADAVEPAALNPLTGAVEPLGGIGSGRSAPAASHNAALLRLVLRDDLTGLYNRRGFHVVAARALAMASRLRVRLLLFFGDLDGLKQINDRFGHAEGDRALVRAAACLADVFRGPDIAARVGGDEFTMLAREDSGRTAGVLCERLRESFASRGSAEPRYRLSLSFGVVGFDPDAAPSLGDLMAQADDALYTQKRTGRGHQPGAGGPGIDD